MNSIGSSLNLNFNLSEMSQRMNDRFESADKDGNSVVSKTEFTEAIESKGLNGKRAEKLFNRLDSNGDGEISQQEHQEMIAKMKERMASLGGEGEGPGFTQPGFEPIRSLMGSLFEQSDNQQDKEKLKNAMQKMQSDRFDKSALTDSISIISDIIPRIDTSA